jgi:hypothetical protein
MSRKRKNYRKKPSMQALMTLGMRDGSDVWLNYVDLNGTMTERVIKPIFVMEERVHAFCYEKRSARQFLFEGAGGRCDKCDKPLLLKWCKKAR